MPFFKFNAVSGRIGTTNQSSAYQPQGLKPLAPNVPDSGFQFESAGVKVAQTPVGASTTAGNFVAIGEPVPNVEPGSRGMVPDTAAYKRLMEKQAAWTKTEGKLLVWQKRGAIDRGSYLFTMGLCVLAVGYCFKSIWTMSWPKKNE